MKTVNVSSSHINLLRKKINKVLAKGDEAVLSLAMKEKIREIITDDDGLGKIAMALGFSVKATPDLLMEGLRQKVLDFQKVEILMRELVVENRLSSVVAELYLLEGKRYVKS
jgi:predicted nucleic acid-binding protein